MCEESVTFQISVVSPEEIEKEVVEKISANIDRIILTCTGKSPVE